MPTSRKLKRRRNRGDPRIDMPFPGMLDFTRLVVLTQTVCVIGGSPNELSDTSEPLYSLYLTKVEKFDNERTESLQKDAETIILFVGPYSCLLIPEHIN